MAFAGRERASFSSVSCHRRWSRTVPVFKNVEYGDSLAESTNLNLAAKYFFWQSSALISNVNRQHTALYIFGNCTKYRITPSLNKGNIAIQSADTASKVRQLPGAMLKPSGGNCAMLPKAQFKCKAYKMPKDFLYLTQNSGENNLCFILFGTKDLMAQVSSSGAQLMSLEGKNHTQYLWQGNPRYWSDRSLTIFPYVARLTKGCYRYKGKFYHMPIHGFGPSSDFSVFEQTESCVAFRLESNPKLYNMYPFDLQPRIFFKPRRKQKILAENRSDKAVHNITSRNNSLRPS